MSFYDHRTFFFTPIVKYQILIPIFKRESAHGKTRLEGKSNSVEILERYKFYLSFENAYHCNDYISEKFWRNSLSNNLIPIIFGPALEDVLKVAPPNSFIHSEEFETAKELVKYIDYLDQNDTAYLEYHQWRTLIPGKSKNYPEKISVFFRCWKTK